VGVIGERVGESENGEESEWRGVVEREGLGLGDKI